MEPRTLTAHICAQLGKQDEEVRRTLMESFENEIKGVIIRGLAGNAPE